MAKHESPCQYWEGNFPRPTDTKTTKYEEIEDGTANGKARMASETTIRMYDSIKVVTNRVQYAFFGSVRWHGWGWVLRMMTAANHHRWWHHPP